MTAVLSMAETAAEIGLSYERFRRVWKELRAQGFPPPFLRRKWDAEAVRAWRASRGAAPLSAPTAPVHDLQHARKLRAQLEALRAA